MSTRGAINSEGTATEESPAITPNEDRLAALPQFSNPMDVEFLAEQILFRQISATPSFFEKDKMLKTLTASQKKRYQNYMRAIDANEEQANNAIMRRSLCQNN